jgi:phosphoribosylformylglycinamidine synthase
MWQLSEAIDGMSEACRGLSVPVVGGNVSLYNESRGRDIDPTPVVGTLGLVERLERRPPGARLVGGSHILLVGAGLPGGHRGPRRPISLAGSRWAWDRRGHHGGRLPDLDLDLHARLLELVQDLVNNELVDGVHDVSDGGLGVALAEMAVRSDVGFRVEGVADHRELFGEGPSRVLVSVPDGILDRVGSLLRSARMGFARLGVGGGDRLMVEGLLDLPLEEARAAWRGALPAALGTPAAADHGGASCDPPWGTEGTAG